MPWQDYPSSPEYGRAAWKRARDACLRRANWRCEIRLPGVCIGTASQADHIDGLAADPTHQRLRAACKPCHAKVTAAQGNAGKRSAGGGDPDFAGPNTQW